MISQGAVLDIARDAIYTILITSAPLLLVSLVSDGYIHSGADTYVCSKDYCGICCNDPLRLLDVK